MRAQSSDSGKHTRATTSSNSSGASSACAGVAQNPADRAVSTSAPRAHDARTQDAGGHIVGERDCVDELEQDVQDDLGRGADVQRHERADVVRAPDARAPEARRTREARAVRTLADVGRDVVPIRDFSERFSKLASIFAEHERANAIVGGKCI